ncbi:FAD/NAD(P)-binding protein [Thermodesulfovibrio thiophilus]|uniref:FAD/NAD(P)-binding protein n=1 Tax=Thermodesulfovibrio thiophilus TaxID=340095 RepID=UPI000419D518|nr:FAD/NAD(P)-binding protein [Thermodesulfovibrio thiophilus]
MEKVVIKKSPYNVKKARIIDIKQLTEKEKLFRVILEDNSWLDYEPGQFIMVSLMGIGEIPISICSSPLNRDYFEICVRAVGKVTESMHRLNVGEIIGIRGPYGKGFPIRMIEAHDLLIIAGGLGLAPLRSLILYAIDNRRDFGEIHILFGCKTPEELLFSDEIEEWGRRLDLHFACTVDRADPDWKGNIGLITSLIPGVDIDPIRTYAAVVGPPIMYKFVIKELLAKGLPVDQILLSFERHMKCGMGKCGRCQIQNLYCCKDGPVFTFKEIMDMAEAL